MSSKPGISARDKSMQASPIRKLVPLANAAKEKGVTVYHLNIGQPDIETPHEILDAFKKIDVKTIAYSPSQGESKYLNSLVKYYDRVGIKGLKTSDMVVTMGGSEAILFAMMAICDPGDEIIVFEPFYTNYNGFAVMANVNLVPILTHADDGFHLPSAEKIEEKITSKTRGVLICNPNNPTGTVYNEKELDMLADICKKHNLYLLSDEVYREFVYDGKKHISALSLESVSDRVIMMDSISKRYSACGVRMGCVVSRNAELMNLIVRFAQARLSSPYAEQMVSAEAVNISDADMNKMIDEYKKRRDIVYEALESNPDIICKKPRGAFYVIVKLPIKDADKFSSWLLTDFRHDNKTVMVAPASGFYATSGQGKDEIRLAYVINRDHLKDAMSILAMAIKEYQKIEKK
ncbi:MAG: aspartate aminotransferase [Candidatus Wallbacteria bacterium GWC2_49_35]|uniref:Aspartate aminotransferase n=1 Tax=Candidatus Wallbacteria bacterium GWC2_49_35 TaxID=1817813 RepID=A0A1F7WFX8_9BACT|nr:MAG: aspartate aminotransferase [Candidatus Wallbacteria bacterium GWC2_49_35]HBC75966.1 aspartate aminotransferase [Candidatus Wallbacteria bacterium]